jgi:hypothetical protein
MPAAVRFAKESIVDEARGAVTRGKGMPSSQVHDGPEAAAHAGSASHMIRLILEHSDHTARCIEGNCPAVTTSRISWSFRCQRSLFQPKPEPLPDINERFAASFDERASSWSGVGVILSRSDRRGTVG